MQQALADVKNNVLSRKQASIEYSIPYSTLSDHLNRKEATCTADVGCPRTAGRPLLSMGVEEELCKMAIHLANSNFGLSKARFQLFAQDIYKRLHATDSNSSTDSMPQFGDRWWKNFKKRHPEIMGRRCDVSRARVKDTKMNNSEESIKSFFRNYCKLFHSYFFKPVDVWNLDETGSKQQESHLFVVASENQQTFNSTAATSASSHYSILPCVNAAGECAPTLFILESPKVTAEDFTMVLGDYLVVTTPKGFMLKDVFVDWMDKFCKWIRERTQDPQLIIMDNLAAHISYEAVKIAEENNVHLLTLPPYSTHLLQPLDVCLFKRFKSCLREQLPAELMKYGVRKLNNAQFLSLVQNIWPTVFTISNIKKSFEAIGLFPLNPSVVYDRIRKRKSQKDEKEDQSSSSDIHGDSPVETAETLEETVKRLQTLAAALMCENAQLKTQTLKQQKSSSNGGTKLKLSSIITSGEIIDSIKPKKRKEPTTRRQSRRKNAKATKA
jgi:hypothetical protein